METTTLNIATLHNLLDYDSRKCISAETRLGEILPEWINKAAALKLKAKLQKYEGRVRQHIRELENILKQEQTAGFGSADSVMQALIVETGERLSHCTDAEVKDACLLACVQTINHYKISVYGTAAAFAMALGMEAFAKVFHRAEADEKQIDDRLSQLEEHEINIKAKAPIVLPG